MKPLGCIFLLMALQALASTLAQEAGKEPAGPGVPAKRLQRMTRGINLGANRYNPSFQLTESMAAQLQKAGVRHVRLPYDPGTLVDENNPSGLRPEGARRLDGMLDTLLRHNIGVIVDMHDPDKRVWNDPAYGAKFVTFWETLAKHLSVRNPDMVFLETANEPLSDTPEYWNELQGRMLAAMRRGAPKHTLVASPNMQIAPGTWDALKALQTLKPYPDHNIVYTFHYYNPFLFTHQGAGWTWDIVKVLHDVPYPSTPDKVRPLLPETEEKARPFLETYGNERWDAAKVAADIRPYIDWGRRNNVAITCNEFGVYKAVSPKPDRVRWTTDVRKVLERNRVPWTAWDDGGGFGITPPKDGQWSLDEDILGALGFRKPVVAKG